MFQQITNSASINATIRPPGSKSITNRALICAALANGTTLLSGVLDSEDTQVMFEAIRTLGINAHHDREKSQMQIEGCGGRFPVTKADVYVANSGTTARFLTAALATRTQGEYRIHGKPRMHERPIADLLEALQQLGADARSETGNGCPPVLIRGTPRLNGTANIAGNISSQFLSALLMALPGGSNDVILSVQGELVSKPYIAMTLEVMRAFGAEVKTDAGFSRFEIKKESTYSFGNCEKNNARFFEYPIEPDASAASYFFAAAAVTGGLITVEGLTATSLQGDIGFCKCLEKMGCRVTYTADTTTVSAKHLYEKGIPLTGIDIDMNAISDTVMTLGVVALFAQGSTRIRNVAHVRHKETDRIAALACELRKFGALVTEFEDGLEITPPSVFPTEPIAIATYDDHRMAMSFAIAGLKVPQVSICDPDCVSKTYPHFFDDLHIVLEYCTTPIISIFK